MYDGHWLEAAWRMYIIIDQSTWENPQEDALECWIATKYLDKYERIKSNQSTN